MDKQFAKGTMITSEEGRIGNEKTGDNQDECSITIHQESNSNTDEISENERQWLYSLEKSGGNPANGLLKTTKIKRVPEMLREIESNISCYEPLVVAIGPFHHRKPKLQSMEKHKELMAYWFADQDSNKERPQGGLPWRLTNSVSIDELYKKIKNIMPIVREYYAEDLIKDFSNEEFAKMMFLDGCFILQYFHCLVTGNNRELKMKNRDIGFIRRDLFLLENQLPFEVLQVLMSCKFKNNVGMEMIKKFFSSAHTKPPRYGILLSIKDFFLDFFPGKFGGAESSLTKQESMKNRLPAHLLELLKAHLIDPKAFSEGGCPLRGEWCSYRSAMELRGAGIDFGCGKSHHLSDIKFTSSHCSALLTLPPTSRGGSRILRYRVPHCRNY